MRPLRKRISKTKNMDELMFELASTAIASTPRSIKNSATDQLYTGPNVLEEQFARLQPTYASTLETHLRAEKPPSPDWVKELPDLDDLPTQGCDEWLCYGIMMCKRGEEDLFYPGSATDLHHGGQRRYNMYLPHKVWTQLPSGVKRALERGYHIASMGWICSIPMPQPGAHVVDRAFMHIMETVFTFVFGGMQSRKADYGIGHLMVWDLEEFEYNGLATHSPLMEGLRGVFDVLTPEELEAVKLEMDEKRQAGLLRKKLKEREKKAIIKATQPEVYAEYRDHRNVLAKQNNIKTVEAKRFACEPCDRAFYYKDELDKHFLSSLHAAKIKELGIEDTAKVDAEQEKKLRDRAEAKLEKYREVRKRALEDATFACDPCGKTYKTDQSLQRHLKSEEHKQEMKDLEFGIDEDEAAQRAKKQKVLDYAKKSREKIKASKKYYCGTCDHAFTHSSILDNHKKSKQHLDKVAAGTS